MSCESEGWKNDDFTDQIEVDEPEENLYDFVDQMDEDNATPSELPTDSFILLKMCSIMN